METKKEDKASWGCLWAFLGFLLICFLVAGDRDGYEKTALKMGREGLKIVVGCILIVIMGGGVYWWFTRNDK